MTRLTEDYNSGIPVDQGHPGRIHRVIDISSETTVLSALADNCNLSKSELKKALNAGAVWLKKSGKKNRRIRTVQYTLYHGDRLELFYDYNILRSSAPSPKLFVQERIFSVWFKPPFVLTQGSKYGDHLALVRIAEKQLNTHIFPIHRLDREASGLVLLAHTKKSAACLSDQFRNRSVKKIYSARIDGILESEGTKFEIDRKLDGVPARSVITIEKHSPATNQTIISVDILTGRKHQIRRHLSLIGYPVSGDIRYGGRKNDDGSLELCGKELTFRNPESMHRVQCLLPQKQIPFLS